MHVLRNKQARLLNHCCSGKAITITYSEFVFYSHIYPACYAHAPCFHLWPFRLYDIFRHYLKTGTIFGQKVIEDKMRISSFCASLCETFLILRRVKRYIIKKIYIGLHVEYLLCCYILYDMIFINP